MYELTPVNKWQTRMAPGKLMIAGFPDYQQLSSEHHLEEKFSYVKYEATDNKIWKDSNFGYLLIVIEYLLTTESTCIRM